MPLYRIISQCGIDFTSNSRETVQGFLRRWRRQAKLTVFVDGARVDIKNLEQLSLLDLTGP